VQCSNKRNNNISPATKSQVQSALDRTLKFEAPPPPNVLIKKLVKNLTKEASKIAWVARVMQHPKTYPGGWMVSGEETVFNWVSVP
jgi:hypothetical protein